jgi:hypothetical protein
MKVAGLTPSSKVGDVVRTGILRRTRRSGPQWSAVEHLARIEHFYGPDNTYAWVDPLCSGKPGRGSFADTSDLCRSCAVAAAREGITLEES